ncbi:MAG: LLM class F420-dependent oxidoreductase [Pseudomonadales bacterium]
MKVEASMMVQNPSEAGPLAKNMEDLGFDGVYTFEGQHDPFFPLVVAAEHTEKIELTTAIAVAFARNPMLLANTGYDLQLMSKGRFNLGLGSQIRPHIEKRYSMQWSKPAARMREMVKAIRAIWQCWNTGEKLDFRGEFYTHTLMTPVFVPGPNPYGNPKIFIAGIGPLMTEVVGEVGDGFLVHPLNTPEFIKEQALPALQKGFDIAGKKREDFEISCQIIIVTGETDEEFENAKALARNQIAFYGSTPAYKPVLDQHDWGDLQPRLNALSKEGEWADMSALISDEVLETIALVGTPAEIGDKVRASRSALVDRISPVAYTQNSELLKKVADEIRDGGDSAD